jgi:LPXTG-site transpeptidase (sortase) family protein
LAAALVPLAVLLAGTGCAIGGASAAPQAPATGDLPTGSRAGGGEQSAPKVISRAREGRPADSTRIRFRPEALSLVGAGRAEVHPASTVDGELRVPENVRHLGWWDGGAYAGDPFGSTVIAGHVDSRIEGLGFFARLLRARVGDRVTLSGDGHRATYAITAVKTITKQVLASEGRAFDQSGDHRLVLITCTGNYRADRGGYDSNLVIYAKPVGRAR